MLLLWLHEIRIMRIDSRVALITGASEGIGAACAVAFRKRGARLALVARSEDKLRAVAQGDDLVLAADLLQPEAREHLVDRVISHFGRLDILVNNAGAGLYAPAHTAPLPEIRKMMELNLFAPLDLSQRAALHMKKQRSGMIVNVGSIAGKVTLPWFTLYSASKYALGSLTDGLRMELRQHGIHTMLVCPGYVKTGFQRNVILGAPPELIGRAKQWAITPERCAEAIVRGVEKDARTVVTPSWGWGLIVLERLFPGLVDRQLELVNRKQHSSQ
jgi:short-subunit dehydrogenase